MTKRESWLLLRAVHYYVLPVSPRDDRRAQSQGRGRHLHLATRDATARCRGKHPGDARSSCSRADSGRAGRDWRWKRLSRPTHTLSTQKGRGRQHPEERRQSKKASLPTRRPTGDQEWKQTHEPLLFECFSGQGIYARLHI